MRDQARLRGLAEHTAIGNHMPTVLIDHILRTLCRRPNVRLTFHADRDHLCLQVTEPDDLQAGKTLLAEHRIPLRELRLALSPDARVAHRLGAMTAALDAAHEARGTVDSTAPPASQQPTEPPSTAPTPPA